MKGLCKRGNSRNGNDSLNFGFNHSLLLLQRVAIFKELIRLLCHFVWAVSLTNVRTYAHVLPKKAFQFIQVNGSKETHSA